MDLLSAQDPAFSAIKLLYTSEDSSPLHFELLRQEESLKSYLHLEGARFPRQKETPITLTLDQESFSKTLPACEGRMKILLPSDWTSRIVAALEKGHPVHLQTENFELTLKASAFASLYQQLTRSSLFRHNIPQ